MSDVDTVTDAVTEPALEPALAPDLDFRAALPADLRDHSALAPIKDLGGLAKSFIAAQELVGADRVALPASDAAADKWEAFYDRVGRPETPDGYRLGPPEDLPDGFSYSDKAAERFREWAHAAGLTPRQASQLHGAFVENVAETPQDLEAADAAAVAEADRAVREAWGGDYDRNLALAGRALDVLGSAALADSLTAAGLMDEEGAVKDPVIAFAFAEAGKMLGEETIAGGGGSALPSAEAARQELDGLKADAAHLAALTDESHPGHRAALDKRSRLFKLAYGDGA